MIKWEIRQEIREIYEEMRTMEIKPNFSAIAKNIKSIGILQRNTGITTNRRLNCNNAQANLILILRKSKKKQKIPYVQKWRYTNTSEINTEKRYLDITQH